MAPATRIEMTAFGYKQPSGWLVIHGCFLAQCGRKLGYLFTAGFDSKRNSLTLREKRVKIGAKVVRHGRYIIFQMAEVATPEPCSSRFCA